MEVGILCGSMGPVRRQAFPAIIYLPPLLRHCLKEAALLKKVRRFCLLARITSKGAVRNERLELNLCRLAREAEPPWADGELNCNVLMTFEGQMIKEEWESPLELSPRTTRAYSNAGADPDYFLVLRVQNGNMDAFDALVEKYKEPIVNFAARTLRDPMEAQDVAQNAFVCVFKKSGRFRFACRFSTWLYAIARNLCRNELRRRSRHRVDLLGRAEGERPEFSRWQLEAAQVGNVPESVFQRELQEKIEQALESLPERERTAILLLQNERLSHADVAAVLGTSRAATKTLIHRGRQALKRDLKPYLRTGAWPASWAEAFAR